MKYRLCILANEHPLDHELWIKAIEKSDAIEYYDIVNLTLNNWLELLSKRDYDLFILRPPGRSDLFKRLYDERVMLVNKYFSTPLYPSLEEVLVYENKRFLRDWLMINSLPHPPTYVFFDKDEAIRFADERKYFPLIGKTNIGASGNGVVTLDSTADVHSYIDKAFEAGIKPKIGPKLKKGSLLKKFKKVFNGKGFLRQRLKDYKSTPLDVQFHFIILQEYIPHDFEWRCVRIGESYFAHKKLAKNNKASGALLKGYDPVPVKLLNFIKHVTDYNALNSVAIDVFESAENYLINEIQCFFGQSDPYQMLVEGKPGRYVMENDSWVFEEGMFNTNESYDLRLKHALSCINRKI